MHSIEPSLLCSPGLSLTSFRLHTRHFPDGTISSDLIQSEDGEDSDLSGFSGEHKGKEGGAGVGAGDSGH